MRRLVVALLGATVLSVTAAQAADMPVKAPVYKPPPVFNWTGFYIGGYVGGAWGTHTTVTDLNGYNAVGSWDTGRGSSFIGGGTIGYNWQPVGAPWLFGLEGEFGYLRVSRTDPDPISPGLDTSAEDRVGDWYGMITGRLGYSWDRFLVYAKGGAAFVGLHAAIDDNCNTGACGGLLINASTNKTEATWTVGGGLEYALGSNWSIKGEYMYIGIDKTLTTCGVSSGGGTFCWDHKFGGVHTAKFGVNYRFGTY